MRAEYGGHVEGKTDLHACSCLGKNNIEIGLTLNMPAILRRTAERPP